MGEKGEKPDLDGTDLNVAIVVARFNEDITKRLLKGAQDALQLHGVDEPDVYWVPGSSRWLATASARQGKGGTAPSSALAAWIAAKPSHSRSAACRPPWEACR